MALALPWALLVANEVLAARTGARPDAASSMQSLLKTAAVVGPLGITPLMALAGIGVAAQLHLWEPPGGLTGLAHPLVWGLLLCLGLLIQFGRSTKITKPVAELLGTGESVLAVVAVALALWPQGPTSAAWVNEAGVGTTLLGMMLFSSTLAVIIVFRTALDFLTWLSPFPFLDFLFQSAKLTLTAGLLLLAVFAPWVAAVANLLLVVLSLILLSWAVRLARFGWLVLRDLTWGRLGPRTQLPRDPTMEDDLGPFVVFAMEVPRVKKRVRCTLHLDAGRWSIEVPRRWGKVERLPLGDGEASELCARLLGLELRSAGGVVLLPSRYRHLMNDIAVYSRAKVAAAKAPALRAAVAT